MRKPSLLMSAGFLIAAAGAAQAQALTTAQTLARQGKVDAAVQALKQNEATLHGNADAEELLCKLMSSANRVDDAVAACEAAHNLQPNNSGDTLELARVYGAKAEHAGTFAGMRMVGRIRANFEAAVQQNPNSVEALSDLGQFYVEAPSIVGGGVDKARSLVGRLAALSPARAARLEGMIAAKTGDTAAADAAFNREVAVSHSPEAYVDLASYDRRRKLWDAAEQNAVLAVERDTAHGPDSLDAADLLLSMHRNSSSTEKALRGYLAHEQTSIVGSHARAHVLLGRLLQGRGDAAGAREQFQQALSLIANYPPALKAMGG